ncbi:MAG: bifunctional response regulator/alkaline phosphatase family protein [bacterium]|nr:bifunctional response regulator/alkaline phosphatase family protein [bacterium]
MAAPAEKKKILWADDEIDLLKPHQIFLNDRGYQVTPVTNGDDAISQIQKEGFDIVLLDEMMAGRDGLSTLAIIKDIKPDIPVIMITKNEEERLMEEAIGQRIDDYLTKPVNPSQILLACKKLLDARQILKDRMGLDYVAASNRLRGALTEATSWENWIDLHVRLSEWDLQLDRFFDPGLRQMHDDLKRACNLEFGKYVEQNYARWVHEEEDSPLLSVDIVSEFVIPKLQEGRQVFLVVVDCMRLDHWLAILPVLSDIFNVDQYHYYSILPTATPYSRNAIFSGLFSTDIAKLYPEEWKSARDEEGSRNRHEHQLLDRQLEEIDPTLKLETRYVKVLDIAEGNRLVKRVHSYRSFPLMSVVFNFLDILTHGRSESEILQEMAPDESAYRSLTRSWFSHSALFDMLRKLAETDSTVVLTTDHGCVMAGRASLAHGNRDTSTSLRFKYGKNLRCDQRHAVHVSDPEAYRLPSLGMGTHYILCKEDYYFVYPTNFNEYQAKYANSFQHGGISMEEMILPVAVLNGK